ncbi:MAG: HD domain-containing protein [Phycisphaerae bacterium]
MNSNRRFINQMMAGETVDQVFLVRDKDLRTTKTGGLYLQCTLCDKTGLVPGRMWQVSESIFNAIPVEGFLQVKGRTEDYRGTLQLVIDACRPWPAEKIDLNDFLACTDQDVEKMWSDLLEITRDIKDPCIRLLIKKFVEDRDLVAAYKRSPAAMTLHHPYIGGLLEHTLSMAKAAKALLPLYPKVNADLVLAGVFLHDIGKIAELSAGTATSYTDRGQLVGHITIAAVWVAEKAAAVAKETSEPFPPRILDLLQHIIISHHGVHEYGSPKLPAVPEAFFVHYLDNLDAKLFTTLRAIDNDPDPNASFTTYLPSLETRVYKRSRGAGS